MAAGPVISPSGLSCRIIDFSHKRLAGRAIVWDRGRSGFCALIAVIGGSRGRSSWLCDRGPDCGHLGASRSEAGSFDFPLWCSGKGCCFRKAEPLLVQSPPGASHLQAASGVLDLHATLESRWEGVLTMCSSLVFGWGYLRFTWREPCWSNLTVFLNC